MEYTGYGIFNWYHSAGRGTYLDKTAATKSPPFIFPQHRNFLLALWLIPVVLRIFNSAPGTIGWSVAAFWIQQWNAYPLRSGTIMISYASKGGNTVKQFRRWVNLIIPSHGHCARRPLGNIQGDLLRKIIHGERPWFDQGLTVFERLGVRARRPQRGILGNCTSSGGVGHRCRWSIFRTTLNPNLRENIENGTVSRSSGMEVNFASGFARVYAKWSLERLTEAQVDWSSVKKMETQVVQRDFGTLSDFETRIE
ncbi:hypothetical protein DFH06DRAFT_1143734 [Mycena polygramma]|nr:hypothetical protein DFH06DRAFT_1143734 [Mycena polygramma]